MSRNRITGRLPRTPPRPVPSPGFMACPLALQAGAPEDQRAWQRQLYERAWEEAAAVVRPSILERFAANLLN